MSKSKKIIRNFLCLNAKEDYLGVHMEHDFCHMIVACDCVHRKKSFSIFPSPAGMSLSKLSLGRNNSYMTSLFPTRESLVSDILAGGGNIKKLFLRCNVHFVVQCRRRRACVYNTYIQLPLSACVFNHLSLWHLQYMV